MKSRVKNFFLNNIFDFILLLGMLTVYGVFCVYLIDDYKFTDYSWLYPIPTNSVLIAYIIVMLIMLAPIILVVLRMKKGKGKPLEADSKASYIASGIAIDIFLIFIYLIAFYVIYHMSFIGILIIGFFF